MKIRFFSDNSEEDPSYQYYTIKNEEENFVGISDIFNLPALPEDNNINNKQIFYLTFDNNEEQVKEETPSLEENIGEESGVKLITLDDGRVFMTTGSCNYLLKFLYG